MELQKHKPPAGQQVKRKKATDF